MIHAAKIEQSPRLQRFLAYQMDAKATGATGLELIAETRNLNPHTSAAELRANGVSVICRLDRITEDGARVYRYFLAEYAPRERGGSHGSSLS